MIMRWIKWAVTGVLVVICSGSVTAFGGLYPLQGEDGFGVNRVTVTYGVDSANGNITMDLSQDFVGSAENFLWLVPVPSDSKPRVETDFEPFAIPHTPIVFDLPPNYCANLYDPLYSGGDGGDDSSRGYPQTEQVNVLSSAEVMDWLNTSPYQLQGAALSAVQGYVDQGMQFIAVRMSMSDFDYASHGSISLRVNYHSDRIVLPLGMLQADNYPFDLNVNILGDSRYLSENYADVDVNVQDVRMMNAISLDNYFNNHSNYESLYFATLKEVQYKGFFTELAAPTDQIIQEMYDRTPQTGISFGYNTPREAVEESLSAYHYLTHFSGIIPTGDGDTFPDAEFVPAPNAPDVSNIRDARSAEPLAVWGCSTRTITTAKNYADLSADLPTGRTQLADRLLPLRYVAHPEGWQLFEINYHDHRLVVIAPRSVEETTVDAFLAGEQTPPMLFLRSYEGYAPGNCATLFDSESKQSPYFRCIAEMWPGVGGSGGTVIGILTSDSDFAAHEAMYKAMVDFPLTYQYMLHPELRHSLILSPVYNNRAESSATVYFPPVAIGYPESWRESMPQAQHLLIMPETFSDPANAPTIISYPASDLAKPAVWKPGMRNFETKNQMADWLVDHFGVNKNAFLSQYLHSCSLSTPLTSFSRDGRTGYVGYVVDQYNAVQPFVLEISAPDVLYADYEHDLTSIRDSVITQFGCG